MRRGDEAEAPGLHGRAACNGGGAQEDYTAGWLPGKTLEKTIDHQSAQTVSDEMQPSRTETATKPCSLAVISVIVDAAAA